MNSQTQAEARVTILDLPDLLQGLCDARHHGHGELTKWRPVVEAGPGEQGREGVGLLIARARSRVV